MAASGEYGNGVEHLAMHNLHNAIHAESAAGVQRVDVWVARARLETLAENTNMARAGDHVPRMEHTETLQFPGLPAKTARTKASRHNEQSKLG